MEIQSVRIVDQKEGRNRCRDSKTLQTNSAKNRIVYSIYDTV